MAPEYKLGEGPKTVHLRVESHGPIRFSDFDRSNIVYLYYDQIVQLVEILYPDFKKKIPITEVKMCSEHENCHKVWVNGHLTMVSKSEDEARQYFKHMGERIVAET